jgi:hypothetical protein
VAAWIILQMAAQPFLYYLIGVGRLRELAWLATPGLLLASAALFFERGSGSVSGVLGAGSVVLGLALLPPLAWDSFRTARRLVGTEAGA